MQPRFSAVVPALVAGVLALAAAAIAAAQPAPSQRDPRAVTLDRMMRPVTVSLVDVRLADAVEFLSTVTDAPIEAHWLDAQSAGLDPDRTVSIDSTGSTALAVLERLLVKAGDEFDAATWQMTPEGLLEIGPRSLLNRRATLVVYDIRDLIFVLPDYKDVPELNLNAVVRQSGGGGGGGIFQTGGQPGVLTDTAAEAERIAEIIMSSVETEQWRDNGGDGASLTLLDGTLLVTAPDYIHRQIAGYGWWTPAR